MTLRPIEMQISLPNSQNVGKIQEQLQQRGQVAHDFRANEQKEQDELKRKQVTASEETDKNTLEPDKEEKRRQQEEKREQKNKKARQEMKEPHPYKGKFIDFSG